MRQIVADLASQPIRNLHRYPYPGLFSSYAQEGSGTSSTGSTSTVTRMAGRPTRRFEVLTGSVGLALASPAPISATPGQTFTISAWVYWESGSSLNYYVTNQSWGNLRALTLPVKGQWSFIYRTFTVDPGETGFRVYALPAAGTVYYVDSVMLTEGTTIYNHDSLGTTKWAGTTYDSQLIGYPEPLESIAGRPDAHYEARHLLGKGVALPADGTGVQLWHDLSGNGRHLGLSSPSPTTGLFRSQNRNIIGVTAATVPPPPYQSATAEGGLGTWIALANTTLSSSTDGATWPAQGSYSFKMLATAAGSVGMRQGQGMQPCTAGTTYGIEATFRATSTGQQAQLMVEWWSGKQTGFLSRSDLPLTSLNNGSNTLIRGTVTAPVGATYCNMWIRVDGIPSGSFATYVDKIGRYEGGLPDSWLPPINLLGGHPLLQLDGDSYYTASFSTGQERTWYAVVQPHRLKGSAGVFGLQGGGKIDRFLHLSGSGAYRRDVHIAAGGTHTQNMTNSAGSLAPAVIASSVSADGPRTTINGGSDLTSSITSMWDFTNSTTSLLVGARDGSLDPFDGSITALMIYPTAHNDATRKRIEQWLGRQYGITVAP